MCPFQFQHTHTHTYTHTCTHQLTKCNLQEISFTILNCSSKRYYILNPSTIDLFFKWILLPLKLGHTHTHKQGKIWKWVENNNNRRLDTTFFIFFMSSPYVLLALSVLIKKKCHKINPHYFPSITTFWPKYWLHFQLFLIEMSDE